MGGYEYIYEIKMSGGNTGTEFSFRRFVKEAAEANLYIRPLNFISG